MTRILRTSAPMAAALTLAIGLSACGAGNESSSSSASSDSSNAASSAKLSGTLNAAGSSAQEAAVAAWKRGFQSANADVTVNYDPAGSGAGRDQFIKGGIDVAASDAYLDDTELASAKSRCKSDVVEVPTYVSPIAVIFHLKGVNSLQLSPATIGAIFQGTVKTWDDSKIKADNPGVKLPSTSITPVHRSDDSGTTQNFTDYLDQASTGTWTGKATQTWPVKGGEGAEGTSGVVASVKGGDGTIGYADASQSAGLGVAKVKVGSSYTGPTAEAAAAVLDESTQVAGRGADDIAITVNRKSVKTGVYPIVLVSYQIACTTYGDAGKANLVKSWLTYVSSSDGQQAAAKGAGSAPISSSLEQKIQPAISKIAAAK